MTSIEIVREIQRLPVQQQFEVHETLTQLLKTHASPRDVQDAELAAAARALLADYQTDFELTAFTALDSDDFHATPNCSCA